MEKTNYTMNNKTISYKVTDDGYIIYLDGNEWVSQHEPYIPYPNLGYEGSCLKQIEELCTPSSQENETSDSIEARVTSLEDMILEMSTILYA